MFWRVKRGRCVGLTTIPPCMSRVSRQCGILNISQPLSHPLPVTGIALFFVFPEVQGVSKIALQWYYCVASVTKILTPKAYKLFIGQCVGVYSISNRNRIRSRKKIIFWRVKCGKCVGPTNSPPSVSRLSRQCGIFNISQPYRPARPDRGQLYFLQARSTNLHKAEFWKQLQTKKTIVMIHKESSPIENFC
jgi:hypothetical protein